MAQSPFFAFVLGLLKPYPITWQCANEKSVTALQRAADNKLLDLNILRVVKDYLDTPFYFTSQNVAVQTRSIIANDVNDVKLQEPGHICELSDGCIAMVEYCQGGLIRIFNDGVLVQSIGCGIISAPCDICTNSSDQLVVTDVHKHQVHVFARDGSHIRSFGSQGSGDGQLSRPRGVCVNSKGHILVADCWNDRISVFDREGKFVRKFGCSGDGRLRYPFSICVDGYDNIYVADYGNHRVPKFSSSGEFLCSFGSYGRDPGQLYLPLDVRATYDGKYIVVVNSFTNRVQILSGSDGSFVASFGSSDSGIVQLQYAAKCTITSDGRILISDYCNHRIHEIRKL
jgi:DNA-binding beta-propeller fold protein YncE